jgi:hypothetical protein
MSYSGSEIDAVFTADNGFDDNTLCTLLSRAAASELGRKCLKDSFVNAGGTVITVRVVIEVAFRSEKMASESYVYDRLRDCHTNEEQCGRKPLTQTQLAHFIFCLIVTCIGDFVIQDCVDARKNIFQKVRCKSMQGATGTRTSLSEQAVKLGKCRNRDKLDKFLDKPFTYTHKGAQHAAADVPLEKYEALANELAMERKRADALEAERSSTSKKRELERRHHTYDIKRLEDQAERDAEEIDFLLLQNADLLAGFGHRAVGLLDELVDLRGQRDEFDEKVKNYNKDLARLKKDVRATKIQLTTCKKERNVAVDAASRLQDHCAEIELELETVAAEANVLDGHSKEAKIRHANLRDKVCIPFLYSLCWNSW